MQNWPRQLALLLYTITAITYAALLYVPHWLSGQLGCKVSLPDLNPFFSSNDFTAFRACIMQTLPDGTSGYLLFLRWHSYGIDFIFPVLLALTLSVLTWQFANGLPRFARQNRTLKLLLTGMMPLAYALCDYVENDFVRRWLFIGNEGINESMINTATTLKFLCLVIALAILIMFALGAQKQRQKRQ